MEERKTFGAFICRRRKELGMTQREFAQRLFVTESAVSKWERGLSYPDITMVRDICTLLEISEHELFIAGEDTEARRSQLLALRYLRLIRNYRLIQFLLYGAIALGCAVGNLCAQGTLSWSWIVAGAELVCMTLTLLPALTEQYRGAVIPGAFAGSVLLLILICGLYAGNLTWFPIAAAGTLLGLSLVLLPVVLRSLPLPDDWARRKTTLYLLSETALLLLLLTACAFYSGDLSWLPVAAMGILFGFSLMFLPVILRQLPLSGGWERRKATLYLLSETALLLLLLIACAFYSSDFSWLPIAAVSTVLGISLLFLPIPLRQFPLGAMARHKAFLYFIVETLLLFLLLILCDLSDEGTWFFRLGLPLSCFLLLLPWGWLLALRYLPAGGWFRCSAVFGWSALYLWSFPWAMEHLLLLTGEEIQLSHAFGPRPDFSRWDSAWMVSENTHFLICLGLLLLTAACAALGRRKKAAGNRP